MRSATCTPCSSTDWRLLIAPVDPQAAELRLFMEEMCCEVSRWWHARQEGIPPSDVCILREAPLGPPGLFADLVVSTAQVAPYLIEVKTGFTTDMIVQRMRRKLGTLHAALREGQRVVLVVDESVPLQPLAQLLGSVVPSSLVLEIWTTRRILDLIHELTGERFALADPSTVPLIREAVDEQKRRSAFGPGRAAPGAGESLQMQLMWHLGWWRIEQLRRTRSLTPRELLSPGMYQDVIVLMADLCSFSTFVRDTRDPRVVREALATFYAKARYAVLNRGGMIDQFVGDEIIAFWALHDDDMTPQALLALGAADDLLDIGRSVMEHWQRHIDRVQPVRAMHVGIALGDLQLVSLRPFSRTYIGAIGDCINVTARLMGEAAPDEAVVSSSFHNLLSGEAQARFQPAEQIHGKNVGSIRALRLASPREARL